MKSYYRVMLESKSTRASECLSGGFIGTHYDLYEDLTGHLPEHWRDFNHQYVPKIQALYPQKVARVITFYSRAIWTVSKGIHLGDIILAPDGRGKYRVGEVISDYFYCDIPKNLLPHRRRVLWLDLSIPRAAMSEELKVATAYRGTVCDIASHREELESLLAALATPSAG